MAIGPQLKWIKSNLESKKILIFLLFISILISYLIVKNFDKNLLVNTILISSAFYLFFVTVRDFFTKKFKNISQNIAHFGFSLLILSILLNGVLAKEHSSNMRVGDEIKFLDKMIQFQNIEVIKI